MPLIHADGFNTAAVAPPARPVLAELRLRWSAYCILVIPSLIVMFAQSSGSDMATGLVAGSVLSVWLSQYLHRKASWRRARRSYRAQCQVWRLALGCLRCGIVFLPPGLLPDAEPDAEIGAAMPMARTREFVAECAGRVGANPGRAPILDHFR